MTQNYDLVLNGAGYMLVPPPEGARQAGGGGANYRLEVTPFKPVAVRVGVREWTAAADGRDGTRWRADGLVPEGNGGGTVPGLVLGPAVRAAVNIGITMNGACIYGGAQYVASGASLFRVALNGSLQVTSFTGIGSVAAGTITAMWVWNGRLYLALGGAATTYASTDGVTITNASGTATAAGGSGTGGRTGWCSGT